MSFEDNEFDMTAELSDDELAALDDSEFDDGFEGISADAPNDSSFSAHDLLQGNFGSAPRTPAAIGSQSTGDMSGFAAPNGNRPAATYKTNPRQAAPAQAPMSRNGNPSDELITGYPSRNENEVGVIDLSVNLQNFTRLEAVVMAARTALNKIADEGLEPQRFAPVIRMKFREMADRGPQGTWPSHRVYFSCIGDSGSIRTNQIGTGVTQRTNQQPNIPNNQTREVNEGGPSLPTTLDQVTGGGRAPAATSDQVFDANKWDPFAS